MQADEEDGHRRHLSDTVVDQVGQGVLRQAISVAQPKGHAPQRGLVDSHNLCPDGQRAHVPGGHHRRLQPLHPVVEVERHLGRRSLLRPFNRRLCDSESLKSSTPTR